jgi:hypothetical protein
MITAIRETDRWDNRAGHRVVAPTATAIYDLDDDYGREV